MPFILIPFLIAAFLFLAPIASPAAPISARPAAAVVELHYIRGGIVQINHETGASRFTPYRVAADLDRRRALRAV
jgi:hypothetical protein